MGELYPLGNAEEDVTSNERTPFEQVILLRARGEGEVTIDKICLAGDAASQFILEGPRPGVATPALDAAVRVTYERDTPNSGDEVDQVALVVQSNASNAPTLIVPICARVVRNGAERQPIQCDSPVSVPAGERDDTLCP